MNKKLILIIVLVVALITMAFFVSSHKRYAWRMDYRIGYAPCKFHVPEGWIPAEKTAYAAFQKTISKDLPQSNINIQIQKLSEVRGSHENISIDDYVNELLLKELTQIHKATIVSVRDFTVDHFKAKDIVFENSLTLKGLTRDLKNRMIIFIAGKYVYSFTLGSFEKDYDIASKDFQSMASSFHFQK